MKRREVGMNDNHSRWSIALLALLALLLVDCSGTAQAPGPTPEAATEGERGTGVLQFRANGEDLVRQGFVTSDGWSLRFDHVYLTLADLTAYQADPPYDAHEGGKVQAAVTAPLTGTHTLDLASGDEQAAPILVGEIEAPAGRYNALSWRMVPATEGPSSGAVLMLQGTAEREGEQVAFTLRLNRESGHTCGDYIGEERKGILAAGGSADIEATFHFDHIFGDGDLPPDDELNAGAVGFGPFASLAEDGILDTDMATLEARLSPDDYRKLVQAHLAHVGEGHCTSET